MTCPRCGSEDFESPKREKFPDGIKRKRVCLECQKIYWSYEVLTHAIEYNKQTMKAVAVPIEEYNERLKHG
jgi:transcriptional regulator NrdR family protein